MKYAKKTLKNGLRIITVPMKNNPTVSVMVFVEAGSNYEDEKINGISHFLEHMFFKGTKNRTLHDITEELDGVGAISNAFTSDEMTAYWAKAHYKHLPKLLDVISDIYLNATLPKEEIEKEKGVIIEEINMYEDLPQRKVWDVLNNVMYGNQPAGRNTLGPKENINKFKRLDFDNYRKKHYVAEKTIIVVAGRVDQKSVFKEISKYFKNIPTFKGGKKDVVKINQHKPAVFFQNKKTDQTHFLLGFHGFDAKSKKLATVEVLSAVLGKGMSSRLFKKMRDELGMCYYIGADHESATDHGSFIIKAGVNNNRFEEAVETIVSLLKNIKEEAVSPKELNKAKEYLIGSTSLSLEASDSWAQFYSFQEILSDKIKDLAEITREIKAVTAEDVQEVAKEIFVPNNANLAVVGNVSKSKSKVLQILERNI